MTADSLRRFQNAALSQAGEQLHGGAITFNGGDCRVSLYVKRGTLQLENGGYVMARTIKVVARDSVIPKGDLVDENLPGQPVKPHIITHDDVAYRITNVVTDPTGTIHQITAVEEESLK